jgi:hypothetical protein
MQRRPLGTMTASMKPVREPNRVGRKTTLNPKVEAQRKNNDSKLPITPH